MSADTAELTIYEPEVARAVIPAPAHSLAADPYVGVAAVPFDEKAQTVLAKYQDVPDEWLDIKPDGNLYLSHIRARNILNEAFGFGGWSLVPVGEFHVERVPFKDRYGKDAERVNVYRVYRLYVNGRYVDEAMGAGTYYTNKNDADYSDACESAKSYALNRVCKTFNLAQKCWDKSFGEEWKRRFAYKDGDKWKKNLGAGSVPPISYTRQAVIPDATPSQTTPSPTTETAPDESEGSAIINLRSVVLRGTRMFGTDSDGFDCWVFEGAALQETARTYSGTPDMLAVEYVARANKKGKIYRNVRRASGVQR